MKYAHFSKRIFQYTDRFGWILNFVSLITSVGSGATFPLMTIVFGSSIAQFNDFGVERSPSSGFDDKIHQFVYAISLSPSIPSS